MQGSCRAAQDYQFRDGLDGKIRPHNASAFDCDFDRVYLTNINSVFQTASSITANTSIPVAVDSTTAMDMPVCSWPTIQRFDLNFQPTNAYMLPTDACHPSESQSPRLLLPEVIALPDRIVPATCTARTTDGYPCNWCGAVRGSVQTFKQHVQGHVELIVHECFHCGHESKTKQEADAHCDQFLGHKCERKLKKREPYVDEYTREIREDRCQYINNIVSHLSKAGSTEAPQYWVFKMFTTIEYLGLRPWWKAATYRYMKEFGWVPIALDKQTAIKACEGLIPRDDHPPSYSTFNQALR